MAARPWGGACQCSCRLTHAAIWSLWTSGAAPARAAGSRSGLSVTNSIGDQLRVCALLAEFGELTARAISVNANIPYSKIHSILYPLEVQHVLLTTLDMPKRYALAHEHPDAGL